MLVAFGSDERCPTSEYVLKCLMKQYDVDVLAHGEHWIEVGFRLGRFVSSYPDSFGVGLCWTGTGVSIAANKVKGARAALCFDSETAHGARKWNNANILAMSIRQVGYGTCEEIIETFFASMPDPDQLNELNRLDIVTN